MGVKATAPFLELVIEECRRQYGAAESEQFPQMIVFSWPARVRFDDTFDPDAFGQRVAEGIRRLTTTGVDFMAIPANLPHLFWDVFAPAATVPLLNMVEIAAEQVPLDAGTVALLAVRPTRDSGLYQRALAARGIRVVANDTMQSEIDDLLRALWRGDDSATLCQRWREIIRICSNEGAGGALLACTDLNAVPRWQDVDLPIIDATHALAERVVSTWLALGAKTGFG
jgi:aspartate racemase